MRRKIVKNIALVLLPLAITLLNISSAPRKTEFAIKTVVIDAGHGGHDSGTRGKFLKEKDVVLKIALKVGGYLEQYLPDVKVIYTRKDDQYVTLDGRAEIANKNNADLFVSIHANALPGNTPSSRKNAVKGTETYVMGLGKSKKNLEVAKRENSVILLEENYEERYEGYDPQSDESLILFELYQSSFMENSLNLASKIESQFKDRVRRKSLGVKQGPFWVLWRTSMPSVLVEVGFLTNPSEEKYLSTEQGQDLIASGIFRAIRDYKNEIESLN